MDAEEVLANCPMISVEEATPLIGVHDSTIRRHFQELRLRGLATYHDVGRAGHLEQRWIPTGREVRRLYTYPGYVSWWSTEGGLRSALPRVEWHGCTYCYASKLFQEANKDWYDGNATPTLISCVFIRGPRAGRGQREPGLIQAVLTYTGGFRIFVCWVGTQLSIAQMMQKWLDRFTDLDTFSRDEYDENFRNPLDEPPDPQYDPTPRPSAYLVLCADEWSFLTAARNLPRDGYRGAQQAFCFVNVATGQSYYEGTVRPRPHDRVEDFPVFPPRRLGNPLRVLRPDGPPHPGDILGSVVPARILDLASEWSGLRVKDYARLLKRSRKEIGKIAQTMIQGEWLQERNSMLYLGKVGILYVARRDRVSPDIVRTRVEGNIAMDHRPVGAHHRHTIAVNTTMIRAYEAGIPVFAGWRAVWNLEDTQLAPDLLIVAATPLGVGVHYIEVERTAELPEQVDDKINPWGIAHGMGVVARVIFISIKREVEELFRLRGAGLPLLTSTLRDVKKGPLKGNETVWRCDGNPIALVEHVEHSSELDAGFGVVTLGEA